MEKLYLSYAASRKIYGAEKLQAPSRFLYEVPSELTTKSIYDLEGSLLDRPDYEKKVSYF